MLSYFCGTRSLFIIFFLVLCSGPSLAVAQPSIEITWDITVTGRKVVGGGYLTFNSDGTVAGHILIRPNPGLANNPTEYNVGFFVIDGTWLPELPDSSNHVFGFFTGTADSNCGPDDQVLTASSFSATLRVGKKTPLGQLNMTAQTNNFAMSVTGVPYGPPAGDLAGQWNAKVTKNKVKFVETFSLEPSVLGFDNLYDLDGSGSSYLTKGCALLFASGTKIALGLQEGSGPLRNVSGSFNAAMKKGSLTGWDEGLKSVQMNIVAFGPNTTITSSPTDLSNSDSASFSFTSTDSSSTFQCRLDGAAFTACTSPESYGGLADGSHNFQVRATDGAGITDVSPASFTWTIDTTPPDTSITTKPSDPSNVPTANFTFTSTESGSTFECSLDGAALTACTSPKNYGSLANGSHNFQVRATDGAGNTDLTPAIYSWTITP